jgi:hypothetical protein
VLDLRLGAQQVEIDCYVTSGQCKASPAGYSNASSCSANFLFSCSCKNTALQFGHANNNTTLKTAAESHCAGSNVVSGGRIGQVVQGRIRRQLQHQLVRLGFGG